MKLLKTIHEKDLGLESTKEITRERKASRAILFNKDKIALLNVQKHHYHKLPGGGIKEGEDINKALQREVLEETGCTFNIKDDVGKTIELKNQVHIKQTSYCFTADVKEIKQEPEFTEKEKAQNFKLIWVPIKEAIKLLEDDKPDNYLGKFIRTRDLVFLKAI